MGGDRHGDGVDPGPVDAFALAATSPVLSSAPVFAPARTLPRGQSEPERDDPELLRRLHDYLHVQVRSGAFEARRLRDLARRATRSEIGEGARADAVADRVVSLELAGWRAESARWRGRTDPERLDAALGQVAEQGLSIRAGVTDEPAATSGPDGPAIGSVIYSVTDIWTALDHGELPLTVRDADGQPAGRHSVPVRAVIDALAGEGLLASIRPDGRIAVPLTWRRRASGLTWPGRASE